MAALAGIALLALAGVSSGLRLAANQSNSRTDVARSMRLYVQVRGAEYPCGEMQRMATFEPYRAALLQYVCPPSKPSCRAALECLVNEFYTADCAGMNQVQEDVCEVCRGTPTAERPGVNATKDSASTREGLVFHEYKQFFRSEYQLYR